MRAALSLCLILLVASACAGDRGKPVGPPEGTFHGQGANTLTLGEGQWALHTGRVRWAGTYRVAGRRLIFRTEAVEPAAGHASDCIGGEEAYGWRWEGRDLLLRFDGEPCNLNRWAVFTGFPWEPGGAS